MSTSTIPQSLTLDELGYLHSLTDSELENWLLMVNPCHWPTIIGQLLRYKSRKALIEPLKEYSPQKPWLKQELFLGLDCKEALYGGAAGGGKSSSLLLAALQFVHVPRYSALILRTDLQRLRLAGGLIPRSHEWLHNKAKWNGTSHMWTFPNGATLQFGYLTDSKDKYRYGSSEYQFIGFDELTEFPEEDYLFMFSRLRMTEDLRNAGIPYRMRAASNPGGKGHEWVKNRFVNKIAEDDLRLDSIKDIYWVGSSTGERAFVPAKVKDNPSVNEEDYTENLMHLPPVTRERLLRGDWSVMPAGLIKAEWLRYYSQSHELINLLESYYDRDGNIIHSQNILKTVDQKSFRRFFTIDTAGGMKDLTNASKGKGKSWTVIGVWDWKEIFGKGRLVLRDVYRGQVGFTDVARKILEMYDFWKPYRIRVEDKTMGPDLVNLLQNKVPISTISTMGQDKVTRATRLLNMLHQGLVYLPVDNPPWKSAIEAEWLGWQGLDTDTNDQIDMAAYAAIEAGGFNISGTINVDIDPRESIAPGKQLKTGWM